MRTMRKMSLLLISFLSITLLCGIFTQVAVWAAESDDGIQTQSSEDTTAPELTKLTIKEQGKTLKPGDTLTVNLSITEESDMYCVVIFKNTTTGDTRGADAWLTHRSDGKYSFTYEISDTLKEGKWVLENVWLQDYYGQEDWYAEEKLSNKSGIFFYVENEISDVTAPELTKLTIKEQGKTLKPGDTVTVNLSITEESDMYCVVIFKNTTTGDTRGADAWLTHRTDGKYSFTYEISDTLKEGKWVLENVWLQDYYGQEDGYAEEKLSNKSGIFFYVENEISDVTAPELTKLTIKEQGKTLKPGDTVTVNLSITEESDMYCVVIFKNTTTGDTRGADAWLTHRTDGKYSFTYEISDKLKEGKWVLENVWLQDYYGQEDGYAEEKLSNKSNIFFYVQKGDAKKLEKPIVKLTNVASTGKIKVSWNAVEGAAKYEVYCSTSKTGTYTLLKTTTATSYTDTNSKAGTRYYYKVKAIHSNPSLNSSYSDVQYRICDLPRPEVTLSNVASTGKIKISWTSVKGAAKYAVYRSTDNKNWSLLSTTTKTSVTNTSAVAGKRYYYKVMAVTNVEGANSAYSEVKYRVCDLASPEVTLSNVASTGKIKISWTSVKGAAKYEVYRSTDNKNWSLLSTTTKTSVTNTSAVAGKRYYYKVKAITNVSGANSAYSEVKYRVCDLARPEFRLVRNSAGKPKLTWEAVKGAAKYSVYYSADNKTWTKLITTTGTVATHSKAKAGTTYYYKVMAVTNVSGANSAYSPVKYIKAK